VSSIVSRASLQVGPRACDEEEENETAPDSDLFKGLLIYVCRSSVPEAPTIVECYQDVKEIATLARRRTGRVVECHSVYRVEGLATEPLDQRTLHDVLKQQRLVLETTNSGTGSNATCCRKTPYTHVKARSTTRGAQF